MCTIAHIHLAETSDLATRSLIQSIPRTPYITNSTVSNVGVARKRSWENA